MRVSMQIIVNRRMKWRIGCRTYTLFSPRRGMMDVLGQVLAQRLLGSAESPQRQQIGGDVSCVCVLRCLMHVGMAMHVLCVSVHMAMFHACA